jgi:DNA-cytosine methyltransferase
MWTRILILEDDEARLARLAPNSISDCFMRVHEWRDRADESQSSCIPPLLLTSSEFYVTVGEGHRRLSRAERMEKALNLLSTSLATNGIEEPSLSRGVVANSFYGNDPQFAQQLSQKSIPFACEISGSSKVTRLDESRHTITTVSQLFADAVWIPCLLKHGFSSKYIQYRVADLGKFQLHQVPGRLVVARFDQISGEGARQSVIFTSETKSCACKVVQAAAWAQWIKSFVRASRRASYSIENSGESQNVISRPLATADTKFRAIPVKIRPNITHSRERDRIPETGEQPARPLLGVLSASGPVLNTAELFAGAGGMGLGILSARNTHLRHQMIFSAEIHPIYNRTLRWNHQNLPLPPGETRGQWVPSETHPLDLCAETTMDLAAETVRQMGGLHLLIGGPPCQGFSNANRNSGFSGNPNNRLVEVFLEYVNRLKPRVFLMENVQGILWTPTDAQGNAPMVVEHLAKRMGTLGYNVYPKLLDAAWYGVPQHRNRFFLLGIHRDLGYKYDHFGTWGPFPRPTHGSSSGRPYVTVNEALTDLPEIGNGHSQQQMPYQNDPRAFSAFVQLMRAQAQPDIVWDHITSNHAPYVIERYRAVPAGGNWEDIRHMMENYASLDGTHSNIYRRLQAHEPSITIGHYRKSMLIHPTQTRGLSLREAARLQSFPDWFRFAGVVQGCETAKTGLSHKQQQLANAVCPLMIKAIGEYLLDL